jgi:hypothetical protein
VGAEVGWQEPLEREVTWLLILRLVLLALAMHQRTAMGLALATNDTTTLMIAYAEAGVLHVE